ncbi:MAG: RNA polymerase sigma factor (TIGR02999 family) [Mariniblastus sp.]|jgi:RNA polymerase sigma factor (TIGR02999 family)
MDSNVTRILRALKAGRDEATNELLPIVYNELRELATRKLRNESSGNTLQPTALVHEAYLRLIGSEDEDWENRAHFFGAAAEAMRRILIDRARAKKSQKRGGEAKHVSLDGLTEISFEKADELIALDEALKELTEIDIEKADLVKLRFFVGLNMEEVAGALGISIRTAERSWAYSRVWLHRQMSRD